jgi:hypothetical protein
VKDMTTCKCPADLGNKHLEACPHFKKPHDPVDNPSHYTSHPSGVEAIEIVEHFPFCIGAAIKYLWRCGQKGDEVEDLKKALWMVARELRRRQRAG